MHRYLYAYGNPTVYIDLYGYESIGAGELSLYYEPGDMIPNKEKLNFTKKFAQTRPESLYSSDTDIEKEQLNELYNELSARGVNKENAFYRSFILVEDGSDEETSRQEALDFLGKGFLKKFTDDPLVREALIERFKGSKTGDLVDISDFWQDEIVAAEERGFKYAINHSRELNPLALPHEVNKGIAKDHLAPKALRDRASIDVWSQRAIALSPFLALGLEQKILGVSRTAFIQNGRQGASTSQRSGTLPISKLPFKAHH